LLLRPFRPDEAPALAAHRSDPEIARYVPWTPPYPLAKAEELIGRTLWQGRLRAGAGALIAIERDGALIGDCAVQMFADDERQASIGFTLAREHQGHGYATEAVRALLGELFRGGLFTEIPLHRVTAECGADNLASQRVLERVGMRREAQLVENIFFKGAWASTYNYAILRNEWCR
jgi:aminoglycoside 6'-N-acetyltransferase